MPVVVEPCDWQEMPQIRQLKAVPRDGLAISEWSNQNAAYLDVVREIRRVVDAGGKSVPDPSDEGPKIATKQKGEPRYRVQRDFDEIDRSDYRNAAFATIKDYFRRAIGELNTINGLRGRFVDQGANSFHCTVVNRGLQRGTVHINVHCRNTSYAMADIYYSFGESAGDNAANGGFNVSSDEYEQFLEVAWAMIENAPDQLSPKQAGEHLWKQFIEQAGITTHA